MDLLATWRTGRNPAPTVRRVPLASRFDALTRQLARRPRPPASACVNAAKTTGGANSPCLLGRTLPPHGQPRKSSGASGADHASEERPSAARPSSACVQRSRALTLCLFCVCATATRRIQQPLHPLSHLSQWCAPADPADAADPLTEAAVVLVECPVGSFRG